MGIATDARTAALDFKDAKTMQADLLTPGQRFCRHILERIQNCLNGCGLFAGSAGDKPDKLVSTHSPPLHAEVEKAVEEASEDEGHEVGGDDCQDNPEVHIAPPCLAVLVGCQQQDAQVEDNDDEFCDTSDEVHKFSPPKFI